MNSHETLETCDTDRPRFVDRPGQAVAAQLAGLAADETTARCPAELLNHYAADADLLAAWTAGAEAAVSASYERLRETTTASIRRARVVSEYQQMPVVWSGIVTETGEQLKRLLSAFASPR